MMDAVAWDLKIGSRESGNFHYKGLRISTISSKNLDDCFEIMVDGDEYLDSTLPMPLPSLLKDDDKLSPGHATKHRSVVGCLGYMASAFRPEFALEASMLSRSFRTLTLRDARKANFLLAWSKEICYNLIFRRGAVCPTAFSDSAGPNDLGTQGGRLFALTDSESHRLASWIYWESRKVKRVCRSTATGEVLSLGESFDTAMWLKKIWHKLTGQWLKVRLVVDSMGTLKNLVTTKLPDENRLRIDLAVVRQGLRRGDFEVSWVPSKPNLSDSLNK
jgi:hypothetical protein